MQKTQYWCDGCKKEISGTGGVIMGHFMSKSTHLCTECSGDWNKIKSAISEAESSAVKAAQDRSKADLNEAWTRFTSHPGER